jgi:hypothetical protein
MGSDRIVRRSESPKITEASFERVFVRNWAASITRMQRHSSPDEYLVAEEKNQDLAIWREIAWKALEKRNWIVLLYS